MFAAGPPDQILRTVPRILNSKEPLFMSNPNQPGRPKTTREILREMEEMSNSSGEGSKPKEQSGGALKSLLGFFVKVVPDEEETHPEPANKPVVPSPEPSQKSPQPGPRVKDLVAGEAQPKFTPPPPTATQPNASGVDPAAKPFDEIYREGGVSASPCSVDELAKLLESPTLANQPASVKVVAVNLALSAKGVTAEAPVADAVRRDRALDAYQAMLAERASTTEQRNQARIQQITQEVEEYLKRKQAEMDALRAEATTARRQSIEFSVRREIEEKRLADLITPFLEGKPNPVTVGNEPGQPEATVPQN
jgi:hypothetical protein